MFGQVTLCEQLEAYMSRFATDNGNAAAEAGNGEAKPLAVPSGMRQMASKKKDELDDKYGGTGGKKVLSSLCSLGNMGMFALDMFSQLLNRVVMHDATQHGAQSVMLPMLVFLAGKEGEEGREGRQQARRAASEPLARHHRSFWEAEGLGATDERSGIREVVVSPSTLLPKHASRVALMARACHLSSACLSNVIGLSSTMACRACRFNSRALAGTCSGDHLSAALRRCRLRWRV